MRVLIFALSLLGIVTVADAARAGPSLTTRDASASADPADVTEEATRQTENQIGLDRRKRRDVQRQLTGLGFDTRVNGRFDKSTRAVIARWQAARGYPETGFLNASQHQALLSESVSTAQASATDKASDDRPARRRGGARHHRGPGGPIAAIGGVVGGVVGGVFGRR
ncbi:peptidoglycan-binding domain-containing protein [Bradyrhizobium sp.]|uniref:peptidoglycan-binding domain-containing protein n=1 Tax=Bradyrhizobium sp. TaxID=376 RepID=UPI002715E5DB|nr:peptidoglycan-binding domain-containing protein [Bradyrhizobium sp.]MDO9297223.1 peptidoglycan-binding domain-containing protein [Bradyrhizobium sp.]